MSVVFALLECAANVALFLLETVLLAGGTVCKRTPIHRVEGGAIKLRPSPKRPNQYQYCRLPLDGCPVVDASRSAVEARV